MIRYGMVIDLDRCIGCLACSIACKVENCTGPGVFWNIVEDEEVGFYPLVKRRFIPRLCMHCENPSCVDVCPSGASYKGEDGIVLVDFDKCIGCQDCIIACPYGVRYFIAENEGYFKIGITPYEERGFAKHRPGVVEKCTFCKDRLEQGKDPACVEVCSVKARTFGDLNNPNSEVAKLIRSRQGYQSHKDLEYNPSVYYIGS